MGYFDDGHLVDEQLSVGVGTLGFFEGLTQGARTGYQQQYRVDSALGLEEEIRERWQRSLQRLQQTTGETFDANVGTKALFDYVKISRGEQPEMTAFERFFGSREVYDKQLETVRSADERIKALGDPNIKSFAQVFEEAVSLQEEIEQQSAAVAERGGAGAFLGTLGGAIAGSFTYRDPLNITTLTAGGFGRSAAMRIATEIGIASGITGLTEVTQVQPARELAGLQDRSALLTIGAAGLGAGLFRGLFEGGAVALRRLERAEPQIGFDFSDAQLRSMFEANQQSPRARAGEAILDEVQALERANPYGSGPTAEARFLAELNEVQKLMGGAPETAIARVLPPPLPFEAVEKQVDFKLVQEQAPAIYARLEQAQRGLEAVDRQIADINTRLENTSLIDAVELVDPNAAVRLDDLQRIVNDPARPEVERAAADLAGQAIINRVGVEKISKALNEAEIKPRKDLQALRGSRKAANKRYRAAYREVEAELAAIKQRQALVENLQQRQSVDLLGNSIGGRAFLVPELRHEVVAARVADIKQGDELLDERATALITPRKPEEGEKAVGLVEDGLADIGLPEKVDANFRVPFEDGEMTVAGALRDLQDDAALVDAIKVCTL